VNQGIADLLAEHLSPEQVSVAEADRLAVSWDLWPRHLIRLARGQQPKLPAAVVWPESSADLQQIVGLAVSEGIALVAYGAGSSVVGGASPRPSEVVVDTKRMNRILEIDGRAPASWKACSSTSASRKFWRWAVRTR